MGRHEDFPIDDSTWHRNGIMRMKDIWLWTDSNVLFVLNFLVLSYLVLIFIGLMSLAMGVCGIGTLDHSTFLTSVTTPRPRFSVTFVAHPVAKVNCVGCEG